MMVAQARRFALTEVLVVSICDAKNLLLKAIHKVVVTFDYFCMMSTTKIESNSESQSIMEYIDVQRFEVIKKELDRLYARKSSVLLEEFPSELMPLVNNFTVGKTMSIHNGKPSMHYWDFIQFFDLLWRK